MFSADPNVPIGETACVVLLQSVPVFPSLPSGSPGMAGAPAGSGRLCLKRLDFFGGTRDASRSLRRPSWGSHRDALRSEDRMLPVTPLRNIRIFVVLFTQTLNVFYSDVFL